MFLDESIKSLTKSLASPILSGDIAKEWDTAFAAHENSQTFPELEASKQAAENLQSTLSQNTVIDGDPQNIERAEKQIDAMIEYLQKEGKMNEADAKYLILSLAAKEAEKDDKDFTQIYQKYDDRIKNKLMYTPEDLQRNQAITILGTKIAIASAIGFLISALTATFMSWKFAKLLPAWAKFPLAVGIPALIAAFLAKISTLMSTSVNNWNDVQHWGPLILGGQLQDLEKKPPSVALGVKTTTPEYYTKPGETIRITNTKTAKPKMFIGTILAGRVTDKKEFVRQLDDQITDDADLVKDATINLTNWMKTLPGKLFYEVQLKYNPFDNEGVRKMGYWCTLSLYISNNFGKRMFIDEILLGPIDPLVYSPVTGENKTISQEVAKDLIPTEIKPTGLPTGEVRTLTPEGEIIDIFPHAPAPVPATPKPEAEAIPTPTPTPAATSTPPPGAWEPTSTGFDMPIYTPPTTTEKEINAAPASYVAGSRPPIKLPNEITVGVDVLNVRSAPNTSATLAGSQKLYKGEKFVAVSFETGENVQGEPRWWKSSKGNFVWVGGTMEKPY